MKQNRDRKTCWCYLKYGAVGFVLLLFLADVSPAQFRNSLAPIDDRLAESERPIVIQIEESEARSRAIAALKRLEHLVLDIQSPGELEADGKLARVSFGSFDAELKSAFTEVESLLRHWPPSRLKTHIRNALYSYRDGAFWWGRVHQPRVINVASFLSTERNKTGADVWFASTIPNTVAIHWRQARKFLRKVENLMATAQ